MAASGDGGVDEISTTLPPPPPSSSVSLSGERGVGENCPRAPLVVVVVVVMVIAGLSSLSRASSSYRARSKPLFASLVASSHLLNCLSASVGVSWTLRFSFVCPLSCSVLGLCVGVDVLGTKKDKELSDSPDQVSIVPFFSPRFL